MLDSTRHRYQYTAGTCQTVYPARSKNRAIELFIILPVLFDDRMHRPEGRPVLHNLWWEQAIWSLIYSNDWIWGAGSLR